MLTAFVILNAFEYFATFTKYRIRDSFFLYRDLLDNFNWLREDITHSAPCPRQ